tara:strand:+ start:76 stop:366 length:291 start_codon:yes stop_codon:yes gene_type:complete
MKSKSNSSLYGSNTGNDRPLIDDVNPIVLNREDELSKANKIGYDVDGELADLFLRMEAANQWLLVTGAGFRSEEYKAAQVAYRAYWDAVDAADAAE